MTRFFRRILRCMGPWLVVLFVALGATQPSRANAELRTVLTELANKLAKVLENQGKNALAIGQFTGPASLPTSGGPGVAQILAEELQKKNIQVKARADRGVKGTYSLTEVPAEDKDDARLGAKVLAVKLEVQLEDGQGAPIVGFQFNRTIRGEATIFHLVGTSAALSPKGTETERDKELREQFTNPKPAMRGTVLRSKAGSPYAIEILVEDVPRAAENKDGLLFVGIKRGECYAVRLINETEHEAAVQLRIDGLSMFAFSELRQPKKSDGKDNPRKDEPLYTAVIVPPRKNGKAGTALIKGWHVNNKDTNKFVVTAYAKSAAASLNHTADVGTITAIFQAAWEEGGKRPTDEPDKRRGGTGDATGRGDRIGEDYREVVRNLGVIRDAISVRYTRLQDK